MERDRLGLIGGLVADRPILTILVLALGLSALAVAGAAGAPQAALAISAFEIAGLALVVAPLVIVAAAPRSVWIRIIIGAVVAAASAGAYVYGPSALNFAVSAPAAAAFVILTLIWLFLAPMFGAMARFAFAAAAAALVGAAGAMALLVQQGAEIAAAAPAVTTAFAIAAIIGAGAGADFAALYAGGADQRSAAGFAARRALAPTVYGGCAGALAFGLAPALWRAAPEPALMSAFVGVGVILCALPAVVACAGVLSLRRSGETLAVNENRRRQAFRRFWRPMRRVLPPNASLAMVAIASIAVIAAAFNMPARLPVFHLLFAGAGAAAAALVLFSLRAGLFVFVMLIVSSWLGGWLWAVLRAPTLTTSDQAAALALAATLFAMVAANWRDARSPRLNPRETTETAMTDALGEHVFGVVLALAAFLVGEMAGLWPSANIAGGYLALMAGIGLLLAPALMTALSYMVRRELA